MKNNDRDILEKYLAKVDKYLKYLPVSEKADILSELKNSFYERSKSSQSAAEIISHMEDPKDLAAKFISNTIIKDDKFPWKKFMQTFVFYSTASITWVIVIPILASLSVSFFFSSGVSVLAGIMGLVKDIIHIPIIDSMKFVFFSYEFRGIPVLVLGLILAIIFLWIGILFWKLVIKVVHVVQMQKYRMGNSKTL